MICAKCGKDNQARFKFCIGCGSELQGTTVLPAIESGPLQIAQSLERARAASSPSNVRVCADCGTVVPKDFQFCGKCGARAEHEVTAEQHRPVASGGTLTLVRPDGGEAGSFPLKKGSNVIGRGLGPLFDADGYLSPRHVDLVLGDTGIRVQDLGSLNGVFMRIVDEELLQPGSVFRIGQQLLRFEHVKEPQLTADGTVVHGSPNPGYWGRLLLVIGPGPGGDVKGFDVGSAYPLFGDATTLGRERGDVVFPEDGYVSGSHARISKRSEHVVLADLRSSNGTFLRVHDRWIPSGSFLLLGQQLFRVTYS